VHRKTHCRFGYFITKSMTPVDLRAVHDCRMGFNDICSDGKKNYILNVRNIHRADSLESLKSEVGKPGGGLLLERVVPESGLALTDRRVLPPRTIVGINPWVIHPNKTIYGQDSESFNPERWLRNFVDGESEDEY
jgi:hypothetical protein